MIVLEQTDSISMRRVQNNLECETRPCPTLNFAESSTFSRSAILVDKNAYPIVNSSCRMIRLESSREDQNAMASVVTAKQSP